jgi:hypothetical protein
MNPLQRLNEHLSSLKATAATYTYTFTGPDNARMFTAATKLFGKAYFGPPRGSKKEASYACAEKVLKGLGLVPGTPETPSRHRPRTHSSFSDSDPDTVSSESDEDLPPTNPLVATSSKGDLVAIVDYENVPGMTEKVAKKCRTYVVVGANHHQCDSLVANAPTSNTTIVVQPSALKDASDTMIVLLVGKLASSPNPPAHIAIVTRDKFASVMMAVLNGGPYEVSKGREVACFGATKISIVTTETQLRKLV